MHYKYCRDLAPGMALRHAGARTCARRIRQPNAAPLPRRRSRAHAGPPLCDASDTVRTPLPAHAHANAAPGRPPALARPSTALPLRCLSPPTQASCLFPG